MAESDRSAIYRLSSQNDGAWGNAGESDDDAVAYTAELANMIADAFPGVDVKVSEGPVSRRQSCTDEALGDEIAAWINDNYVKAVDRVEAARKGEVRS